LVAVLLPLQGVAGGTHSEKYIEAQKKLLNLAIHHMESASEMAGKRAEAARTKARDSSGNSLSHVRA